MAKENLSRSLSSRQMQMIALGGTIVALGIPVYYYKLRVNN